MSRQSSTRRALGLTTLSASLAALFIGYGEPGQIGRGAHAQEGAAAEQSAHLPAGWIAAAEPPAAREVDARAELEPVSQSGAHGSVSFLAQDDGGMTVVAMVGGLEPGPHGFHVHETGDCSAPGATSAEGHFTPDDDPHGAPADAPAAHHAGDLGNVVADETGMVQAQLEDAQLELEGEYGILGRAVIVHRQRDDLESQPSGSAGDRVACGVIRRAGGTSPGARPDYDGIDVNDDAWLTREETQHIASFDFDAADADEDGVLSRQEYNEYVAE